MTLDLSKIKPGDEVLVRYTIVRLCDTVRGDGSKCIAVGESADKTEEHFSVNRIVSHTPKSLEPGDWVKLSNGAPKMGEIVATAGAFAWVQWPYADCPLTEPLAKLERVP